MAVVLELFVITRRRQREHCEVRQVRQSVRCVLALRAAVNEIPALLEIVPAPSADRPSLLLDLMSIFLPLNVAVEHAPEDAVMLSALHMTPLTRDCTSSPVPCKTASCPASFVVRLAFNPMD